MQQRLSLNLLRSEHRLRLPPPRRWPLALRIAFRFWSIYFALYVMTTQMLGGLIPFLNVDLSSQGPIRWTIEWVARSLFGITTPLVVTGSGSGDKTFDWLHAVVFLVLSAALTVVWSVLARRVAHHETAHKWFRLFLRFSLATTMLSYGSAKFIPLQMPFPGLTRLLEPYGHFSPMGVLWASIGASSSYEIFTGLMETSAAVLLFIPRTATLGALVTLACTVEIFTLNMTYDVPVKLFSFQLILMSLYLAAPDIKTLLQTLVLNRGTEASPQPLLFKSATANRVATIVQVAMGIVFVLLAIDSSRKAWTQYGGGSPRSPLYGIWNIAQMSVDGVERPLLATDRALWRRVVFDQPTAMAVQKMDDTFVRHQVTIDTAARSIAITSANAAGMSSYTYERIGEFGLTLTGGLNGKKIEMRLEFLPRESFLLVTRGFNWIQEYPFNR